MIQPPLSMEQIVTNLRQVDMLHAQGKSMAERMPAGVVKLAFNVCDRK